MFDLTMHDHAALAHYATGIAMFSMLAMTAYVAWQTRNM